MICVSTPLSWIAYALLTAITDFFIEFIILICRNEQERSKKTGRKTKFQNILSYKNKVKLQKGKK